jgi:hypothetical protein
MPPFSAMQQDVFVAIRTAGQNGTGTWDDPYDGSTATKFDGVMSGITSPNLTVRLLPGVYQTAGNDAAGGTGWTAKANMRIVGGGIATTTIKLTPVASATRYAVAMNFASATVDGFEISDLTIDCGLVSSPPPPSNTIAGAIRVRGKNVFIRRVKVVNYGTNVSSSTIVNVITAAGESSENCVISECSLDVPSNAHAGIAQGYVFEGSSNGHRFCSIRECALMGNATFEPPPAIDAQKLRAIVPGIGLGTVIEGNQIVNCAVGVYSETTAKDLVIWNNYFRNVSIGAYFKNETSTSIGRLVLIDNSFDLATFSGSLTGSPWQTGIRLNSTQTSPRFTQVVLRKNVIRDVQTPPTITSGLVGIHVQRTDQLIAENNVISNIAEASGVYTENCNSRKFFNNEDQGGKLLRGFNGSQRLLELEDAVQDVLLPL